MLDRQSASRSEREVVAHTIVAPREAELRVARRLEHLDDRLRREVADGQAADAYGGGQVPIEQHGRRRQHVADVVEPVPGIVHRQPRARLDVQCQEIADRIAVFGTVQPMDRGTAGIGMSRRGVIEGVFEPRGEGRGARGVRARPPRRRHLATADFVEHSFEDGGVLAHVGEVHLL